MVRDKGDFQGHERQGRRRSKRHLGQAPLWQPRPRLEKELEGGSVEVRRASQQKKVIHDLSEPPHELVR